MSVNSIEIQQTIQTFITPELTHRIELILHLLEHSKQLIIIKGDTDSGKTTLLNEIIKQDKDSLDIKAISITESFSFEQFELSLWAAEARDKQKVPVLLLDDIERIDHSELNYLNTLSEVKSGIRFCLFSLPTFIITLEEYIKESSNSEELHIVDIPPFTQDQTLMYIRNRYSDNPFKSSQFNEELAKQIYQFNHGLPGKINKYCEQYLNDPATNYEHKNETKNNNPFLLGVVTAVIVLFVVFVLFFVKGESKEKSEKIKIKLEVPEREVVELEKIEPLSQDIIEAVETPIENQSAEINPTELPVELNPDVIEESIALLEPPAIPEDLTTEDNTSADILSPEIIWLNEQDSAKYVLQLLGAQERKTIELYKNSFADPDEQLRVITTLKDGKEWHILIYGLYESREKAKESILGLPARAKQLSPWPRSIESIKTQLN